MCNDCQQQELKGCTWFELVDWLRMLINYRQLRQQQERTAATHFFTNGAMRMSTFRWQAHMTMKLITNMKKEYCMNNVILKPHVS